MTHIVKRRGHRERFDERKVYASVYAACLSSHTDHRKAKRIAAKVTDDVKKWVSKKKDVTSGQIAKQVVKLLGRHNKDAAFMYMTHKDIA